MTTRTVSFRGALGDTLSACLDLPVDARPVACALFAHCFTCSKDLKAAVHIARALCAARIAVLRFDFTGLGQSAGEFADTNFSSNVEDLVAAAAFMEDTFQAPSILVGHSLGGAAVLHAAHRLPSVRAVATIAAPSDPTHVGHLLESSREQIEQEGEATVRLGGRPFRIKRQFLDDLARDRMDGVIRTLGRALLVFHSPIDQTVGIENAARIYEQARHPKSFVSLDQADHLLTDVSDARYVGSVLGAWAQKYIELPPEEPPEEVVKHDRVVTTTGEGFRTEIMASGHAMVADEPLSVGGTDEGPTPYDLLAAGLGACTGMTLRMYAARKRWPLEEVVVRIRHEKIYSDDEARSDGDAPARLDRLTRTLEIKGPLDDDQRARLLQIADRCPVHRTLELGVSMVTELEPRTTVGR